MKWGDGEEVPPKITGYIEDEMGGWRGGKRGRVKGIFYFNAYDDRRLARRLWAKGGVAALA